MDVDEALEALALIEPAMAIPMHYGDIVGTKEDAVRFQELSPVPVSILPLERG
jgi:L-ascorbate metabolism protein UlaG (beta-lactamase superfamily)